MTDTEPTHAEDRARRRRAWQRRRLQSAIDKVAGYREGEESHAEQETSGQTARSMDEWHDLVSQRIEDAMRQGLFDNLSGRGKPLNLRRDPFLPEDQQMAVTLLRNNDLAPEWITERKIILAAIDALRADLRRAAGIMRCDLDAATDDVRREQLQHRWRLWLADWQARIDQLNRRILVQNLKQPVRHLEICMLRLPEELARAGSDAAWGAGPSEE